MHQLYKLCLAALIATAVSFGAGSAAHADVSFTPGNNPQPDEENIFLNSGVTGSPVFGTTHSTGLTVAFSSTIDTLTEPSSGQAQVGAQDGGVHDLTVTVPGGFYTDLIINPFLGDHVPGLAAVSVMTNHGTFPFIYPLGDGSNFLTITTSGGEQISSTEIMSVGGFDDLRQPRISGASLGDIVPEPCTLALLGTGVLPLFGRLRRRRT